MSKGTCSIDGCDAPQRSYGWCVKHYERWRKHGDPLFVTYRRRRPDEMVCDIDGCGRRHLARGYCSLHYERWKSHGDPFTVMPRSNQNTHKAHCKSGHDLSDGNVYVRPTGRRTCLTCRDQYARRWFQDNKDRLRRIRADWREANRDKSADYTRKRRAKRLDQYVEDVERSVVYERDAGVCGICGYGVGAEEFEVDHIVPLSRGGLESYGNVQATHRECNRWKADRTMDEIAGGEAVG